MKYSIYVHNIKTHSVSIVAIFARVAALGDGVVMVNALTMACSTEDIIYTMEEI